MVSWIVRIVLVIGFLGAAAAIVASFVLTYVILSATFIRTATTRRGDRLKKAAANVACEAFAAAHLWVTFTYLLCKYACCKEIRA